MTAKVTHLSIVDGVVRINGVVQNNAKGNSIEINNGVVKIDGVVQKPTTEQPKPKSFWQAFREWLNS